MFLVQDRKMMCGIIGRVGGGGEASNFIPSIDLLPSLAAVSYVVVSVSLAHSVFQLNSRHCA